MSDVILITGAAGMLGQDLQQVLAGRPVTALSRADLDITGAVSNEFEMEWPPRSGTMKSFPEVDRVAWFDVETARVKLLEGQRPFLDRLLDLL